MHDYCQPPYASPRSLHRSWRCAQLALSRPLGLETQICTDLGSVVLARVTASQQLRLATGQVRRPIRSSTVAAEVGGAVGARTLITHRWLLLRWRSGSGLISWSPLLWRRVFFGSRAALLRGVRRTGDCGGRGRCVLGSAGDRGGLWFCAFGLAGGSAGDSSGGRFSGCVLTAASGEAEKTDEAEGENWSEECATTSGDHVVPFVE